MDTHFRQSGVSFEALASSYLRETPPQVQVPKHRNGRHAAGVAILILKRKLYLSIDPTNALWNLEKKTEI